MYPLDKRYPDEKQHDDRDGWLLIVAILLFTVLCVVGAVLSYVASGGGVS